MCAFLVDILWKIVDNFFNISCFLLNKNCCNYSEDAICKMPEYPITKILRLSILFMILLPAMKPYVQMVLYEPDTNMNNLTNSVVIFIIEWLNSNKLFP